MGVWGVPRLTILISLHWQLFVLAEAFSSRSSYYAPSVDDSISTKPKLKVRGNPIPNLNGTCPPPNAGSWCNDGDADAFNDTEIAGYLGDLLIPDQFWVSLKDESPSYETGDERTNKLWATMLEQGKVIKGWLDKYAGPKRNRLDALLDGGSSSDVVTKFYEYYNPERTADVTLEGGGMTGRAKINEPLELSNTNAKDDGRFTAIAVYPRPRTWTPTCIVGIHTRQRLLITLDMEALYDTNRKPNRLHSSELQWQAWRSEAQLNDGSEPNAQSARKLKYWMQQGIMNKETNAIMDLAHDKYPDRIEYHGDLNVAHGIWRPPTSDNDDLGNVWTRFLSTPNMKVIVNALADHAGDIDDPYPVEIHTFPELRNMVVVLGQMPGQGPAAGTVATS